MNTSTRMQRNHKREGFSTAPQPPIFSIPPMPSFVSTNSTRSMDRLFQLPAPSLRMIRAIRGQSPLSAFPSRIRLHAHLPGNQNVARPITKPTPRLRYDISVNRIPLVSQNCNRLHPVAVDRLHATQHTRQVQHRRRSYVGTRAPCNFDAAHLHFAMIEVSTSIRGLHRLFE